MCSWDMPVLFSSHSFRIGPAGPVAVPKVGARPLFLLEKERQMSSIQTEIEAQLAQSEPDVEVLLAEVVGDKVRLFIDHPEGVSLALCERVTHCLESVRARYALEVSSPGRERPLTKPDHFRRYVGRRARVRTRGRAHSAEGGGSNDGRQTFTGELVGASDTDVTLAADSGVVQIPYADINRSHLVE